MSSALKEARSADRASRVPTPQQQITQWCIGTEATHLQMDVVRERERLEMSPGTQHKGLPDVAARHQTRRHWVLKLQLHRCDQSEI